MIGLYISLGVHGWFFVCASLCLHQRERESKRDTNTHMGGIIS